MIKLTSIILLVNLAMSNCDPGCLKCHQNDCMYCDKSKFFYLVENVCTFKEINNCKETNDGEICDQCIENYYSNSLTGECLQNGDDQKLENCQFYSFQKVCSRCKEKFILQDQKTCTKTDKIIENCLVQNGSDQCSQCQENYYLSYDLKSCIKIPEETNCMNMGNIKCQKCKDGYMLFENTYLYHFEKWLQDDTDKIKNVNIDYIGKQYYSQCAPLSVPNCKRYQNYFYQCEECQTGYFLTQEKICVDKIKIIIDNCKEYLKENYCRECIKGYYKESDQLCLPHSKTIEFCSEMSLLQKDQCKICTEGYYLVNNTCIQRETSIENCEVYKNDQNLCETCKDGYDTNINSKVCLEKQKNCEEELKQNNIILCVTCSPKFYFEPIVNKCEAIPQEIDNCEYYEYNTDFDENATQNTTNSKVKCKRCLNNYFLTQEKINGVLGKDICYQRPQFTHEYLTCKKLNTKEFLICNECHDNEILVGIHNFCSKVPISNIDENAIAYEIQLDENGKATLDNNNVIIQIKECKEGFYKDTSNNIQKCKKITIDQCKKIEDSDNSQFLKCTECLSSQLENYFINRTQFGNKCILSYDHITENCLTQNQTEQVTIGNNSNWNNNVCTQCKFPYYSYTFNEGKFCVQIKKIKQNFEVTNNLEQCQNYSPFGDICKRCNFQNENQLVIKNNKCQQSCDDSQIITQQTYEIKIVDVSSQIQDNFYFDKPLFYFQCEDRDDSLPNCLRRSVIQKSKTDSNTSNINKGVFVCDQCQPGYLPLVNQQEPFKYFEELAFQPAKATNFFQIKDKSFSSQFNRIATYGSCIKLTTENTHTYSIPANLQLFNNATIPSQPDYRENSSFFTQCRALGPILEGKYYCQVCQFGFKGYFMPIEGNTQVIPDENTPYMMVGCTLNDQCDVGTYYNGLTSEYMLEYEVKYNQATVSHNSFADYWVTCHQCKGDLIPTFSESRVGMEKLNDPSSQNIDSTTQNNKPYQYDNKIIPQSYCDFPGFIRENLNSTSSSNSDFPDNCGVQMIDYKRTLQKFNEANTRSNPICIACKPGYKPEIVVINGVNKFIKKCTQIQECAEDGMDTFNKCTQCQGNYAINSLYDNCINYGDLSQIKSNCYQVDVEERTTANENTIKCIKCNKGYVLDKKGNVQYCNPTGIQKCKNEGIFEQITENNQLKIVGEGCIECDIGYLAVDFGIEQKKCIKSQEIEDRNSQVEINDCEIYSSFNKCEQCKFGSILTQKSDLTYVCVKNETIPNCKSFQHNNQDKYTCTECNEKYVLISGECQDGSLYISNCKKFKNNDTKVCEVCDDGYINYTFVGLTDLKVQCYEVASKILNCEEFSIKEIKIQNINLTQNIQKAYTPQSIVCDRCKNGFYPIRIADQQSIYITNHENNAHVKKMDTSNNGSTNIQVDFNPNFNTSTNPTLGERFLFCVANPQQSNCKIYKSLNTFNGVELNTDFSTDTKEKIVTECEQCQDSYYLVEGNGSLQSKCLARTNYPYSNCAIDDKKSDSCELCADGYYIRDNTCQFKPTGVKGCIDITELGDCVKCQENYFVNGNQCHEVPQNNRINQCKYYRNETTCSECNQGYAVFDNKCEAILISHCLKLETPSSCLICEEQYFLISGNVCSPGTVSNCLIHKTIDKCLTCQTQYYPNQDDQCIAISDQELITNCLYYESQQICKFCHNSSILTKDGQCFTPTPSHQYLYNQLDDQCDSYIYEDNCRVCKTGYKFQNGVCEQCSLSLTNCMYCDYKDDSVCHYCAKGYYMDNNQECKIYQKSDNSDNLSNDQEIAQNPDDYNKDKDNQWVYSNVLLMSVSIILT